MSFVLRAFLELNLTKYSVSGQILTQLNTLSFTEYIQGLRICGLAAQTGTPQTQLGLGSAKCLKDREWRGHAVILTFFNSSESKGVIRKVNATGLPLQPLLVPQGPGGLQDTSHHPD